MPSASTKTEIPVSAEPTDPFKRVLVVVDKKVRNLEKRKLKLDAYKEKKDSGAELEKDQQVAVDKYGEVLTNLEFARDLQKQFSSINTDAEKLLKKQAKRGKSEKQNAEVRRIKEVLQLQGLLDSMGGDKVRQDFMTGKHGAIVLTEENLDQIDELYKLVSPSRDGEGDFLESLSEAADHIVSLLEAKDKSVVGSTYKTLKELLDLISGCGYFERVKEEEGKKVVEPASGDVEFEVVEHKDVPAPDSEEVQASLPPDVPEEPEPTPEQPPQGMTTAEADAFFNTPVSQTVEQQQADLAAAAAFSQQQRRPFQEIVSSVQGNFNFLQDSTIEAEQEFSPHMDPAVVAAHPMPQRPPATQTPESTNRPPSGFGASYPDQQPPFPEQQSLNTAVTTVSHGSTVEQSVYSQANQQQSQDFSNSGFTQSNRSHLQSDISFSKGTVESAPISHTQYDIPPQIPMPPGHEQSNSQDSQGGSEQDKKAGFQMNPNATEFQLYNQGEEQSKTSEDNFQGGTFTNSGFNSRDQRGGRGGFRGGRGGNRDSRGGGGNMSNGYSRGGRGGRGGNYNQGYQQRGNYRSNDGYQSYNNGNNYNNSGGFQKRGGDGERGAPRGGGNREGQRGGFSRGGGGTAAAGPRGAAGAPQPGTNPRGFGRPNFNN